MTITVGTPDGGVANFPDGTSPEVMKQALRKKFPPQASGWKKTADDYSNAVMSGMAGGATQLAGMFGDAREATGGALQWGAGKLGLSPETSQTIGNVGKYALGSVNPLMGAAMPTTQDVKNAVNFREYQPQSTGSQIVQTGASFIPQAIVAPGKTTLNAGVGFVSGAASEGAGKVAHALAPQYEPQVRAATAIITSLIGSRSNGAKALTTAELKAVKDKAYAIAEANGETIAPEVFDEVLNRVGAVAYGKGARPHLTNESVAALKYADEYSGRNLPIPELDKVRQLLKSPGGSPHAREREVSHNMVGEFDQALNENAISTHADARAANTAYKRSQLVDNLNHKIDLKASQYNVSGKENATRQVYRNLAGNEGKTRYMDQATRDAIDKVAMGGPVENAARTAGKFAPTGVVPVMAAFASGRLDLAAALMGGGAIARTIATALTGKNRRIAEFLIKHGGQEGAKVAKTDNQRRLTERLIRSLLSAEASQGAGPR